MGTIAARTLIVAGLATAVPAGAQTDNEAGSAADRIIVTGARAPVDADRLGSAATIITRADIERVQARYLTDVLRTVPGFAISLSGSVGSQAQVRARGGEANHVLVLIDGVRANDPASGDEFRWEHLATGAIERVEIVRGPQSALWGSDAVDAVVNVVTRSPTGDPALGGYAEGGSNDTMNAAVNMTGNIAGWNLGGGIESLDTAGTNISRTGSERDGADLVTASIGLSHEDPDGLAFGATLRATDATSEFDAVDALATGLPADGNLETRSDNLIGNIGASLTTHAARVVWQVRAGYFESQHVSTSDDAGESSTASDRIGYLLQTDIAVGDNAVSLALEHADTAFEQRGEVGFGDPNQNQRMRVTSSVAEYRHLAADRLSLIVSGRYDRHSDFDDALTGKVSMAYQWTEKTRLRASLGTGQKTPTFIERFGFFPEQFIGNPELKPESSLSYDVGFDRSWLGGALSVSGSLYRQSLDDEIDGFVFDSDSLLFTAENVQGASERKGVELATDWRVSDSLRVGANYTYTDAREESGESNVRELRRPRHSGGLSLSFSPRERFEAIMVAEYGGERDDLFFPPFPEPSRRVTLTDYWLVDLTVHFRLTPTVALFARGTNLLDEDYEQVYGFSTLGRAAYLGVRADFDR